MKTHPEKNEGPFKIGLLLTTGPEHQNTHTLSRLIEALLGEGHAVSLFLMDDGIYNVFRIESANSPSSRFEKLLEKGLTLSLCTQSAEGRGVFEANALPGIGWTSQHELSRIVARSDRFLAFGA